MTLSPTRGYLIAVAIFIVDQLSKWAMAARFDALRNCPPAPAPWANPFVCDIVVLPFLNFTMVWNPGVSLGMFTADSNLERWILVAVTGGIAGIVAWWLRREADGWQALAYALILGGALGNIVDRVRFGAVFDFVNLKGIPFWSYVFNVADAAITIGVIVLLVRAFFGPKPVEEGQKI